MIFLLHIFLSGQQDCKHQHKITSVSKCPILQEYLVYYDEPKASIKILDENSWYVIMIHKYQYKFYMKISGIIIIVIMMHKSINIYFTQISGMS